MSIRTNGCLTQLFSIALYEKIASLWLTSWFCSNSLTFFLPYYTVLYMSRFLHITVVCITIHISELWTFVSVESRVKLLLDSIQQNHTHKKNKNKKLIAFKIIVWICFIYIFIYFLSFSIYAHPLEITALPTAPTDVIISEVAATSVRLEWSYKGSEDLQYYVIQYKPKNANQVKMKIKLNSQFQFLDSFHTNTRSDTIHWCGTYNTVYTYTYAYTHARTAYEQQHIASHTPPKSVQHRHGITMWLFALWRESIHPLRCFSISVHVLVYGGGGCCRFYLSGGARCTTSMYRPGQRPCSQILFAQSHVLIYFNHTSDCKYMRYDIYTTMNGILHCLCVRVFHFISAYLIITP